MSVYDRLNTLSEQERKRKQQEAERQAALRPTAQNFRSLVQTKQQRDDFLSFARTYGYATSNAGYKKGYKPLTEADYDRLLPQYAYNLNRRSTQGKSAIDFYDEAYNPWEHDDDENEMRGAFTSKYKRAPTADDEPYFQQERTRRQYADYYTGSADDDDRKKKGLAPRKIENTLNAIKEAKDFSAEADEIVKSGKGTLADLENLFAKYKTISNIGKYNSYKREKAEKSETPEYVTALTQPSTGSSDPFVADMMQQYGYRPDTGFRTLLAAYNAMLGKGTQQPSGTTNPLEMYPNMARQIETSEAAAARAAQQPAQTVQGPQAPQAIPSTNIAGQQAMQTWGQNAARQQDAGRQTGAGQQKVSTYLEDLLKPVARQTDFTAPANATGDGWVTIPTSSWSAEAVKRNLDEINNQKEALGPAATARLGYMEGELNYLYGIEAAKATRGQPNRAAEYEQLMSHPALQRVNGWFGTAWKSVAGMLPLVGETIDNTTRLPDAVAALRGDKAAEARMKKEMDKLHGANLFGLGGLSTLGRVIAPLLYQEQGNAYAGMLRAGVSKESANTLSQFAGLARSSLQIAMDNTALGNNPAVKKIVSAAMKKIPSSLASKFTAGLIAYGTSALEMTAQMATQEVVNIASEELGKSMDGVEPATAQEIMVRMGESIKGAAQVGVLMGFVPAVIQGLGYRKPPRIGVDWKDPYTQYTGRQGAPINLDVNMPKESAGGRQTDFYAPERGAAQRADAQPADVMPERVALHAAERPAATSIFDGDALAKTPTVRQKPLQITEGKAPLLLNEGRTLYANERGVVARNAADIREPLALPAGRGETYTPVTRTGTETGRKSYGVPRAEDGSLSASGTPLTQEQTKILRFIAADPEKNAPQVKTTITKMFSGIADDVSGTLKDIETQIRSYEPKGVSVAQSRTGDGGYRISNNDMWYRDFYAKNGRAPTKKEIPALARQILLDPKYEGLMYPAGVREKFQYFRENKPFIDGLLSDNILRVQEAPDGTYDVVYGGRGTMPRVAGRVDGTVTGARRSISDIETVTPNRPGERLNIRNADGAQPDAQRVSNLHGRISREMANDSAVKAYLDYSTAMDKKYGFGKAQQAMAPGERLRMSKLRADAEQAMGVPADTINANEVAARKSAAYFGRSDRNVPGSVENVRRVGAEEYQGDRANVRRASADMQKEAPRRVTETEFNDLEQAVRNDHAAAGRTVTGKIFERSAANTPEAQAARHIAAALGVKVEFVHPVQAAGDYFNGLYHNGVVYISDTAEKPFHWVLGHEVAERLKSTRPELWAKYKKTFEKEFNYKRPGAKAYMDDAAAAERAMTGKDAKLADLMDEAAADFSGDNFANPTTIQRLVQMAPDVAKAVVRTIRGMVARIERYMKGISENKAYWEGKGEAPEATTAVRQYLNNAKRVERAYMGAMKKFLKEDRATAPDSGRVAASLKASLSKRGLRGDALLNSLDLADEIRNAGGEVGDDGFAVLYHRTSSKAAQQIIQNQRMLGKEDGLFFSTIKNGQAAGYGDSIVKVRIPLEKLQLDDVFDGEAHLRMEVRPNTPIRVIAEAADTKYSLKRNPQVDTPEFKKWFGESKITDDDGQPLVVYHGTDKNFTEFKTSNMWGRGGTHFSSDPEVTKHYGDRVIPAYVSLKKPLIVDAGNRMYDVIPRPSEMPGRGTVDTMELAAYARDNGYDGVFVRDVIEAGRQTNDVIAFHPEQIKSATANTGAFDAGNPDIRYSMKRSAAVERAVSDSGTRSTIYTPKAEDAPKQAATAFMMPADAPEALRVDKEPEDSLYAMDPHLAETTKDVKEFARTFYRLVASGQSVTERITKTMDPKKVTLDDLTQMVRAAGGTVEHINRSGLVDRAGNKLGNGESWSGIIGDIPAKKTALYNEYRQNLHNIDRMSLEKRAFDRLTSHEADNPWLLNMSRDKKEALAKNTNDPDHVAARLWLDLEAAAKEAKNKPVLDKNAQDSQRRAQEILKDNPEFSRYDERVNKWNDDLTHEWAVGSGLWSEEQFQRNKELYSNYIPTYRKEYADLKRRMGSNAMGQSTIRAQRGKAAVGSTKEVVPLQDSFMENANRLVRAARKNELYMGLINWVKDNPKEAAPYAKILKTDKKADIHRNGINGTPLEAFVEDVDRIGLQEIRAGVYQLTGYEGGKPVTALISGDVFHALDSLVRPTSSEGVAALYGIGKAITNPFKALVTGFNPWFIARNMLRDIPNAYINSIESNPLRYTKFMVQAMDEIRRGGTKWQQYEALGGTKAGYYDVNKGFKGNNKPLLRQAIKQGATPGEKLMAAGRSAKNAMSKAGEVTEALPRFAEYLASIDKYGDTAAGRKKAIYNAAEITVNFSRSGVATKLVDSWVAYLNPYVQGVDKFFRQIKKRPGATLAKTALIVTTPALALMAFNRGNPHYNDLDNRTKDTYYVIPNLADRDEKGWAKTFIKIPKTRENGAIMGAFFERIGRWIDGQKEPWKGFPETLATNFAPQNPFTDNIGAPLMINLASNRDFAGREIVPSSMKDRSPENQYDATSSQIAIGIGQRLKMSPKQIDYLLNSYTGVLAQTILPMSAGKPENLQDVASQALVKPLQRNFTADPRYQSGVTQDFYDALDKANRASADRNFTEDLPGGASTPEDRKLAALNEVAKAISDLRKQEKNIMGQNIPQREKDQQINALRDQAVELARKAVEDYDKKDTNTTVYPEGVGKDSRVKYDNILSNGIKKSTIDSVIAGFDTLEPRPGNKTVTELDRKNYIRSRNDISKYQQDIIINALYPKESK